MEKEGLVLDVLMMTTVEALNTMDLAFTQMVRPGTTMAKIRGVTMVTPISLSVMNLGVARLVGG